MSKKADDPINVLVIDPTPDKSIINSADVRKLIKDNIANVRELEVDADIVMGPNTYRVFPHTTKFAIAVIKQEAKKKKGKP